MRLKLQWSQKEIFFHFQHVNTKRIFSRNFFPVIPETERMNTVSLRIPAIPKPFDETALLTCAMRARASGFPEHRRLCHDPYAQALAGERGREILNGYIQTIGGDGSLYMGLRTRFFDDLVTHGTHPDSDIRQVVILGAGMDTRAARLAREGVTFFEVDEPSTQEYKKEKVQKIPGYPQTPCTYVPCDFARSFFFAELIRNGFNSLDPALFILEGVSMYLDGEKMGQMIGAMVSLSHQGSLFAFDYLDPIHLNTPMSAYFEKHGNPMKWGTATPEEFVRQSGMSHAKAFSFETLDEHYRKPDQGRPKHTPTMGVVVASMSPLFQDLNQISNVS